MMADDDKLKQDVLAELLWEPSIRATNIDVAANSGIITLSGHVESFAQRHAAERAALRVRGVKAIALEIEVGLPAGSTRSDDQIAAAAVDRMASDVSVHAGTTTVTVDDGWITLSGEVDWNFQKEAAEQDVRCLSGVVGITNEITIRPQVDIANLSDQITHAMHRSWFFDPKAVTVLANGGKVRLIGTVRSVHELEIIEKIAWSAPGVTSVEESIDVLG